MKGACNRSYLYLEYLLTTNLSQLQSLKRTDKKCCSGHTTDLNRGQAGSVHKVKFDDKHDEVYIYSLFRLDD